MSFHQEQALYYLDEHIVKLEAEEAKKNALARQAALQQAMSRSQQSFNSSYGHPNPFNAEPSEIPQTQRPLHVSGPSSSSARGAEYNVSTQGGISRSNSNVDVSKKRPLDDSSDTSRPTKKTNTGTRPQFCYLCGLSFHPVVECRIMNSDGITMQRRLQQLETQLNNPDAAPYINALRNQYSRKIKQAMRPPMK